MELAIGEEMINEVRSTLSSVLEECLIQELQTFDAFLAADYVIIPGFL